MTAVFARDPDELERRRNERRRYLWTFLVSLLLHLPILLAASLLTSTESAQAEEEIRVPLTFQEPEPAPPPAEQATPSEPEPEPEPEPEEEDPPAPEDESLLGFESSEGSIEARPTRPQGPEAEIKAPPAPNEVEAPEELAPQPEEAEAEPPEDAMPEPEEPSLEEDETGPEEPIEEAPEPVPADDPLPPLERPSELGGTAPEDAPREEEAPRPGRDALSLPPRPSESDPPNPRPDDTRRVPDFDVPATGGFWADDIKFESTDYDWSNYSTKLYFAIYRAWLRELLGRVRRFERDQALEGLPRIEGSVAIAFTIVREGESRRLEIVDPSVLPTLDEASSKAIQRAVIPPLPRDFPRDEERVTFRFRLAGWESAQQIERRLRFLQLRGEF
jgi:TonB family protein